MENDHTIWSIAPSPSANSDAGLLGFDYYYETRSFDDSNRILEELTKQNSDLFTRIAANSNLDAVHVWLGGVSGGWFEGNEEAAMKAGAPRQPNLDILFQGWRWGISNKKAEDIGNALYGATGYELFMNILTEAGISENIADSVVRPLLRAGGGVYQAVSDFRRRRFMKVDHNWYGEEESDVPNVEAGMDLASYKRMSRKANKLGLTLEAKDFGLSDLSSLEMHLLDFHQNQKLEGQQKSLEKMQDEIKDQQEKKRRETLRQKQDQIDFSLP